MRLLMTTLAAAMFAAPAFAQQACTLERAVYAEKQSGYELHFRPIKPWESVGMVETVFDLVMPDGRKLWGEISGNMGTSRDVGQLYFGCPAPAADDEYVSEEVYEDCRQWEGVVYAIDKGEPGFLPFFDAPAPERLLLTDLGRKIRYSGLVDTVGDEPWDVFDFKRCAK